MSVSYTHLSGIAMDKDLSKLLYRRAGLPVAPSVTFTRADMPSSDEIVEIVGPQSFVKPVVNGSSYGISLVKDPSELASAIELAFEHGDKAVSYTHLDVYKRQSICEPG